MDDDGNAKLSDIGVAKYVGDEEKHEPLTGQGGTIDYTAPEVLKDKSQLTKESLIAADTWSLGLMMLELCMLDKRLFSPYSPLEEIEKTQNSLYDKLKGKYSKTLIDLIFKMIKCRPSERVNIVFVKKQLEDEFAELLDIQNQNRPFEESKIKIQQVLESVAALKNENTQLKNEVKKLQSLVSEFQAQISNEISDYLQVHTQPKKIPLDFSEPIRMMALGAFDSGKTCIVQRFGSGIFEPNHPTTVTPFYVNKTIIQNGQSFKLEFWTGLLNI